MTKVKNPLLSLGAIGNITKAIVFARRRKVNIAEQYPVPFDAQSLAQLSWRHMYQKAIALWHALSAAEKQDWESLARAKHMTGYAYFISLALKPNPGLYLPLQGGTMTGEILMSKHRLRRLPHPAHTQDPLRVQEYNDDIAPYLYHEGARVYYQFNYSIPHATDTTVPFNLEQYDTDTIHDNVVNNSRLTCQTAGKYIIIAHINFATNNVGRRMMYLWLNNATSIAQVAWHTDQTSNTRMSLATIYHLAVGDFVEVKVRQESGGALNILTQPTRSPYFMMQRIGS